MKLSSQLKVYVCGTDLNDLSLGATDVVVHPSVNSLKKRRGCWKECGILELSIKPKVVLESKLK